MSMKVGLLDFFWNMYYKLSIIAALLDNFF